MGRPCGTERPGHGRNAQRLTPRALADGGGRPKLVPMKSPLTLRRLLLPVLLALAAGPTQAGTVGSDNADENAYTAGRWESGVNGGTGFRGWNLVASKPDEQHCGFVLAPSPMGGGVINSHGGRAFGMHARGQGSSSEAYRTFEAPLEPGQSFSVDLAVNFRSGHRGLDLRSAGEERRIFNFNIGTEDHVVHGAATGNGSIGDAYHSDTVFTVTFTQTSTEGGTWKIERRGGVSADTTGTYEGQAGGVKFYVMDTDESPENDLWVNNLTITGP